MRYRFILIDADDTLFDFHASEKESFFEAAARFGVEKNEAMYKTYTSANAELWKMHERGEIDKAHLKIERFQRVIDRFSLPVDAAVLNDEYMTILSGSAHLLEGAEEICEYMSSTRRLFLITNGSAVTQHGRIEKSGIGRYFEKIFISEELGAVKPSFEFFDRAVRSIDGFDKKNAIVIGDSVSSDMRGAFNYGLDACFFNHENKEVPQDIGIKYVIHRLDEIPSVID